MTEKQKAEAYVREKLPELMELSFGCEIRIATPKRYEEYDESGETKATVVHYSESGDSMEGDYDVHHIVWLDDWNELNDCSSYSEDEYRIIGHPIQLQHWLRVLGSNRQVNHIFWIDCEGYCVEMMRNTHEHIRQVCRFNLTTGQPATEADYKSFNEIVGV